MRETNFDEIKQLWELNKFPVMLYVHSPYCKQICRYCGYRGRIKDATYDTYFTEYLPDSIDRYKDVISKQEISCIYFGGGTPNYEPDLKNLQPAFTKVKDISCVEKVIELHANLPITDDTIDILSNNGFTTVILCIQTFNKDFLRDQCRAYEVEQDLSAIIGKFHKKGIRVGSDLMYMPEWGLDTLRSDISTLASLENRPDEISVAPLYQAENRIHLPLIQNCLDTLRVKYNYMSPVNLRECACKSKQPLGKCIRLIDPTCYQDFLDHKFYNFIYHLDEAGLSFAHPYSCLGIGSYNNPDKMTFSYFNEQYTIAENWDGKTTHYYVLRERSFYDKCRDLIDWMEDHATQPVPAGLCLQIINNQGSEKFNENTVERMPEFSFWTDEDTAYVMALADHKDIKENQSRALLGYSDRRK